MPRHLRISLFWQRCNRRIEAWVAEQPDHTSLCSRFEDLCLKPDEEVSRICHFLGVEDVESVLRRLDGKIRRPSSMQRWKQQDRTAVQQVVEFLNGELRHYGYLQ